jgi:hypothetical protein
VKTFQSIHSLKCLLPCMNNRKWDSMTQHQTLSAPLYARLLGPSWHALAEVVRRHHLQGSVMQAAGSFRIHHGDRRLARWLVWLLRMPAEGQAVKTRLVISAHGESEEWRRTFGDRLLVTRQRAVGAEMAESFGWMEIRFRLDAIDGGIIYHQTQAAFSLGRSRVPLPVRLAPRVAAWEKPDDVPGQVRVRVEVVLPLLGRLITYEGTIAREEPGS